jgi:diguanylate cyclase (GGDEF)-like protein/PAS domain S-box-containing protein
VAEHAPPATAAADGVEVDALIARLHETVQRLESLTGGEVDAVTAAGGQTYLLSRAQDHARQRDDARRLSLLDALPAAVALLDPVGRILVVNAAWRLLAADNRLRGPDAGDGPDDLTACGYAVGADAAQALRADVGVRAVLAGTAQAFSLEYASPARQASRWFLMTVCPLAPDEPLGAIVMHVDVTALKQARDALDESRQRLAGVIESAPDGIVSVDDERRIVLCNPAAERMFGYPAAALLGQRIDMLLPARLRAGLAAHIETFGLVGASRRREGGPPPVIGLGKSGEEFPIEASISMHRADGHRVYTAILRDVTERARAGLRIRRLNHLYAMLGGINKLIVRARERRTLFDEACRIAVEAGEFQRATVAVVDPATLEGRVVAHHGVGNDAGAAPSVTVVTARSGASEEERPDNRALARGVPVVCNDIANDPAVAAWRDGWMARGHRSIACFPLTADGAPDAVLTLYADVANVFDPEELRLLKDLAGDLSFALGHIAQQDRLEHLALYDSLTGLAQHGLFLDRLAQHLRAAADGSLGLAVFVIDIDRFRSINDHFGRAAGDTLLRQVSDWLKARAGDANRVARISADRFAVVLPEIRDGGNVTTLLERAQAAFPSHPFRLDDAVFRIAAKVGVAIFPQDGVSAHDLFRNAEAALKKAKSTGDRLLFYARAMSTSVAGHLTLETQLRHALEREEYVLHYQPKVSLASGLLVSAEALIRWNDPRTGLVPPGRFIPILEETGLIHDVGRWALVRALADYRRWRDAGLAAVRIAVNVSPLQLRHHGFLAEIEQVLGTDGRGAEGLELEITESLIMEDVQHSIATLAAVRALGVCVAIDDFGTGFSSLSYLARLPVDALKIDRSFVVDMAVGPQGLALVSTIIGLAHALKLKVVAEGVETEEQSRLLRVLNCDELQGFLFGRPVPADVFEARFLAAPRVLA